MNPRSNELIMQACVIAMGASQRVSKGLEAVDAFITEAALGDTALVNATRIVLAMAITDTAKAETYQSTAAGAGQKVSVTV